VIKKLHSLDEDKFANSFLNLSFNNH